MDDTRVNSRREFLKKGAYVAPFIATFTAVPSFASIGSGPGPGGGGYGPGIYSGGIRGGGIRGGGLGGVRPGGPRHRSGESGGE